MSRPGTHRERLSRAVRPLLGCVLLTAAGLKLYGLNVSPFAQYGWLSTPEVQLLAVAWELVLGVWLLSGAYRVGAWVAAAATFLTFAVVSLHLGLIGQASCGCFGVVKASPWHALAVDVAALGLLAVAWPGRAAFQGMSWADLSPVRSGPVGVAAGVAAALIALAGVGSWVYGSPAAALARLRGQSVGVWPQLVDFGRGSPGDGLESTVAVRNWTGRPVRLIGGTSDCSCTTLTDLPLTIDPGPRRPSGCSSASRRRRAASSRERYSFGPIARTSRWSGSASGAWSRGRAGRTLFPEGVT